MGTDAIKVIYNIINNVSSENLKLKASMFIIDKVIQIEDNVIIHPLATTLIQRFRKE